MIGIEHLIDLIYSEDIDSQIHYLNVLSEIRRIDVKYMMSLKAFFVPNEKYLLEIMGSDALNSSYDLYNSNGYCKWVGYLMIPVRDCKNKIISFTGWCPFSKSLKDLNKEDYEKYEHLKFKYQDSSSKVFDKSKHLFIPNGYRKMLEDDYLILTDGVFDCLDFASMGFSAGCNLGSYVSDEILFIMSLPSKRFVAYDNDEAGLKFYNSVKKIKNTTCIIQSKFKDFDDFIRNNNESIVKKKILEGVNSKILTPIRL